MIIAINGMGRIGRLVLRAAFGGVARDSQNPRRDLRLPICHVNDSRSSIIGLPSTMVTDATLVKIYAWYDNETGYACRMVDLADQVLQAGRPIRASGHAQQRYWPANRRADDARGPRQQLALSGGEKTVEDVGFYYAANATGRLAGTLLSGWCMLQGGIAACLLGAGLFLLCAFALTRAIKPPAQAV